MTPVRAAAMLSLLASAGAMYGLASTPAFTLAGTDLPELRWTTPADVTYALATPNGTNLFQLRTGPIEDRLRTLPAVATARVQVSLPDTIVVTIQEREAIVAWAVGDSRFLIDRDGVVFANLTAEAASAQKLPTIRDSRPAAGELVVGGRLDSVDLDAATRLASLTPADIGSVAKSLIVTVTEANGFVLVPVPRTWIAVFGLYTPTLRTPELIPGQVRLLRSLLAGRENAVAKVILADADSGTFIPKATPAP